MRVSILLGLLWLRPAAAQQPWTTPDVPLARAQAREGRQLLDRGQPAAAQPLLESAYALSPTASNLRDLVRCYRSRGLNASALQLVLQARDSGYPPLSAEEARALDRWAAELLPHATRLTLHAPYPNLSAKLDGVLIELPSAPTPLVLEPGEHALELSAPGYESVDYPLAAVAGQEQHLAVQLEPWAATGRVRIVDKSGQVLDLVLDQQAVGKTPWEGELTAGPHVAQARNERYVAEPLGFDVVRRGQSTVTLTSQLRFERAALSSVTPGAQATLDGKSIPLPFDGYLALGVHQLEVTAPGFTPQRHAIQIAAYRPWMQVLALQPAPVSDAAAPTSSQDDTTRFGVSLGVVSVPRPVNLELGVRGNRWFGFGFEYGVMPKINFDRVATRLDAFRGNLYVFPLGGSFYLGLGVGYQRLTLAAEDRLFGQTFTARVRHGTVFISPQFGWRWQWEWGLNLGLGVGLQIPLSSSPKVQIRDESGMPIDPELVGGTTIPLLDETKQVARFAARYPIPIIDLFRLGFYF